MKKVFISGPYTLGDVAVNVRNAILAADALIDAGFAPFVPHLSHFQHMQCPRPYEDWMRLDAVWLTLCDCLLRLPGESAGADRETRMAEVLGLPVYHSVESLIAAEK